MDGNINKKNIVDKTNINNISNENSNNKSNNNISYKKNKPGKKLAVLITIALLVLLTAFAVRLVISHTISGTPGDLKTTKTSENQEILGNAGTKVTPENLAEDIPDSSIHQKHYTDADVTDYNDDEAYKFGSDFACKVIKKDGNIELAFDFRLDNEIPVSDDETVYLFALRVNEGDSLSISSSLSNIYDTDGTEDVEDVEDIEDKLVGSDYIDREVHIRCDYQEEYLYKKFVPAVKHKGSYVALNEGQFIINPEFLANNSSAYPKIASKKGILLDANTLGTDKLSNLNVKRLVFNIPLSMIIGETEDEENPTIEYEYDGEIYHFNGYRVMLFDTLFTYLTDNNCYSTAIVLNDWNKDYPQMIHPKSRARSGRAYYYAFNTAEDDGVKLLEAVATFLANRYSGTGHGQVYDWVIANEINQHKVWNYMNTSDLEYYVTEYEKSFRIFYNAIKSSYANAKIYYSVDHDWNDNGGFDVGFFNGRELVLKFGEIARRHGDYSWGLSIHPYPQPLTKVRFWRGSFDKTDKAPIVTPMNLSAVTNLMLTDELLSPQGRIRDISVTELGFTSSPSEELQAAAFAYCYYIIEDNQYINSFLLNRQTDDDQALKSGLRLGLFNNDYTDKVIAKVFAEIDSDEGADYIDTMLSLIGYHSLEEALEAAR